MKRSDRAPLKHVEPVGAVLKEMFSKAGIEEQISRHQAWLVWDQLVGEQIAARARPKKLRGGVLEVQVDHPVWMQQLHLLKPEILKKINTIIPNAGIVDLYLRQSASVHTAQRAQKQKTAAPPLWQKTELQAWEKRAIEEQLAAVKDQGLQAELRRLMTLQKQVDKHRQS